MKKIGYISTYFPKLTETFVLNEAIEMERRGDVEVLPYALRRARPGKIHAAAEQFSGRTQYSNHFFSVNGWLSLVLFAIVRPSRLLAALRYILKRASLRQMVMVLGMLPQICLYARKMESAEIAHIHAHFGGAPTSAALLISRLTGIPFSFTVHAFDIFRFPFDATLSVKVEAATNVFCISEYNKQYLLDVLEEPDFEDKLRVIRCGVSPEEFETSSTADTPRVLEATPLVLSVGSLISKKGHAYSIIAAGLLRDRGVNIRLVIIGGGDQTRLQRLIRRLGLEDAVELKGALVQSEVQEILSGATLFVLPCVIASDGDRDGIPVALMEAMLMGIPVISTSVSGIPELVLDGETGLIVPERNAGALANSIQALLDSPDLAQRLSVQGRAHVKQEFELRRNVGTKLDLMFAGR